MVGSAIIYAMSLSELLEGWITSSWPKAGLECSKMPNRLAELSSPRTLYIAEYWKILEVNILFCSKIVSAFLAPHWTAQEKPEDTDWIMIGSQPRHNDLFFCSADRHNEGPAFPGWQSPQWSLVFECLWCVPSCRGIPSGLKLVSCRTTRTMASSRWSRWTFSSTDAGLVESYASDGILWPCNWNIFVNVTDGIRNPACRSFIRQGSPFVMTNSQLMSPHSLELLLGRP